MKDDEDELSSQCSEGSTSDRDEIEEVHRFSRKDTNRIRFWRMIIAVVLLVTALAVTLTTYEILNSEQQESFVAAFEKFSRAVGDAALLSQKTLRTSQLEVCNVISIDAERTGQNWPNYTSPYIETYFGSALDQARAELSAFFPVVESRNREAWTEYATSHLTDWTHRSHLIKYGNLDRLNETNYKADMLMPTTEGFVPDDGDWEEYWPMWLYSPPPAQYGAVNWNLITVPDYEAVIEAAKVLRGEAIVTRVRRSVSTGTAFTEEEHNAMHSRLKTGSSPDHPHCFIWTPVYEDPLDINSKLVAVLATGFAWDFSLRALLPESVQGVIAVISNDCDQTYTYEIAGKDAFYLGEGDLHEKKYDAYKIERELSLLTHPLKDETPGHCQYSMNIYPSSTFEAVYDKNIPEIFAAVVAITFTCIALVMIVYDILVQRRNNRLVANAARSNAVVSSLFPGTIRDRVLEQRSTMGKMKMYVRGGDGPGRGDDKPLAELFLDTTVLFADITSFTAWSSVREPSQVFTLLENVYSAFDAIAKRRGVFKVETVGDCYVAATGIPEPRKDHVAVMVRFAQDCIHAMEVVTKNLEKTLGPGTGELGIRIGIHSGPVTAGVLRGDRARFQLFGDTMNTTARIENAGASGKIHISQRSAELLQASGKDHWLCARNEPVFAKGKGALRTFWVDVNETVRSNTGSTTRDKVLLTRQEEDEEGKRLIEWNVETLSRLIKQIVSRRVTSDDTVSRIPRIRIEANRSVSIPLEEVKEIITLPEFDHNVAGKTTSSDAVELDGEVVAQLRDYVTAVSQMYYQNPFHNFGHASHVVMSVMKLMSRIVEQEAFDGIEGKATDGEVAQSMHDHTYGITSDPLTQFACAFSALIHDVDHRGIPNTQLIDEDKRLSAYYKKRSVAEQNSFDLAWDMLMDDRYTALLETLCKDEQDLSRLRELVVNSVMATDIVDKDLKELRNSRWKRAFSDNADDPENRKSVNRKATIVIEHLIQASDVSHTMQHWHIYRKWNEHLFEEMYRAYKDGRAKQDPSGFWYESEISFFQFYIIPLAKKLKDCGVFGVSSGEYLNYAESNLEEWKQRGQEVVNEIVEKCRAKEQHVCQTKVPTS